MKIINIGLSILVSLGLAISPIQASETDVADETNEESVVNSNEDVESNADEIKIQSISVRTEDDLTTYPLDENETKNIRLVVNKIYTDGHVEQTTDYQYYICAISNNLSISNATDTVQDNMMYSGTNNELSVTKTSRGNASFSVKVILDDFMDSCCLSFNDTKFVNITLNAGDGQFEDGTTTYTYPFKGNGSYQSPNVIAPKGYKFVGWYDENGVGMYDHALSSDTTFYARYKKLLTILVDANNGTGDIFTYTVGEDEYCFTETLSQNLVSSDGKILTGFKDKKTGSFYRLGHGYSFDEDTTLVAQWAEPIMITFDCDGGSTNKGNHFTETWGKNMPFSSDSSVFEKPVKEGMIFTGWHVGSVDGYKVDPYSTSFDEDTTLYASYSKAVHINLNLDALNMESQSIEVAQGESVRLANIFHVDVDEDKEIMGYRIDGTNTIIDKNQELVFDEDINLTAIVKKRIKLTYDSNGAGFDSVSEYASKDNCHLNNVFNKVPEGKYFAGWAANSPDGIVYTSATSGMPFTEDTTLYAVWKDGVTIHLDLGEGVNGSIQNGNVVKKGSLFRLHDVNVSQNPNGKKLAGWRIDDNSKVLSANDYFVLNKDITLHAVWEDTITVTIKDSETDDVLYTSKIAKGTSFQDWYVGNDFIPKGKSLLGWTLDKDKKNTIDLYKTTFDKDVTLYPVYVDNIKITLDWGNDGGKGYINLTKTNTLERAKGNGIYFDYTILSTPKGKTLAGWKIGDTKDVISAGASYTNLNYELYKDTTLHAIWKDTVKITLNANGEKFANNQEIIEKEYIKNNVVYSSYNPQYPWEQKNLDGTKVITGWRVGSPNGPLMSKKLYNEFDKDTTYYAVWGDLITITFKNRGIKVAEFDNTNAWTLRNVYHTMVRSMDPNIINDFDDETFLGWYNTETGEKLTEDTVFTKDCVFEARTKKGPAKITLDYNGGSGKLNEVTTMSGYLTNYMLNDPFIVPPKNKVFVGWSLEKDGKILGYESYDPYYIMNQDTTLYAKYADEATLTIHYNGETYIEKVPVNEWMMFMRGDYCVIDGKTYYSGQSLKFTKDTDVYLKESTSLSNVYVSHKDLTKLTGNGYGWVGVNCFIKWHHYNYIVKETPGKEVNLELDESFIPKGMKFDKWETVGDITIKDPTSKKTSFIMPKNELGKAYEIYATYKPIVPLQFEKESIELNKSERSQLKVNGDYETLTWSSSDPTTVQVDQNGHIHAVKSGKAIITVKDESGKIASCVVTVTNKLKNLSLSEKNVELKGQTEKKLSVTLTPSDADEEKLTWTSSNEGVVKVSEDGTLTPVSCGEATITVESKSGLTDRCKVTVSHDWKLESKVDATADQEGKKVYRCTLCHETKEETIPKLNGKWVTDSYGKWYQYSDGTYEKSGFKEINGKTYYFQSNGYVKIGKLSLDDATYMFDADGVMVTGWYGNYYLEKDGKMKTNAFVDDYYLGDDGQYVTSRWIYVDGKDYYMNAYGKMTKEAWQGAYYLGKDGVMVKNDFTPDGYYVGASGAYLTSQWFKHDGKDYYVNSAGKVVKNAWLGAYYLGSDGAMLKNQFTPDGYYVGKSGTYLTNQKITASGKDYYLNVYGTLAKNQWAGDYYVDSNNNPFKDTWSGSYYLGSDGKYVKNQFTPDGYYCGADGVYVTNRWIVVDGKDYYMNASGKMTKDTWVGSYYLGSDGAMLTDTYTPDGYYVDENGLWTPSKWVQSGGNWCYRHSDGTFTTNDFEVIGSQTYYFDSNGYMVTGWKQLGSNWYYFNGSGIMVQNNWAGNYYFDGEGKMVRDRWIGNYYVGSDGCMVTNRWIGNYYVGSNGLMVTGWQCISGQWYYFDSNGIYQTGERYLGGEYYYFNAQGVMQTGTAADGWEYNSSGQRMVYWSRISTNPVYHRTPHNIRSYNLVRGTYSQAVAAGKTNRCKNC